MTVALLTGAQDLAETRATLNQLIEEFNAAIAAGGGGVTFPLTAPANAIAINSTDPTGGYGFASDGSPNIVGADAATGIPAQGVSIAGGADNAGGDGSGSISIFSGDGIADNGGSLSLAAGDSSGANGGPITIRSGDTADVGSSSGNITITIGSSAGDDGVLFLQALTQQQGIFALDTGQNDAGIAIGSLPGTPTLGMMAVVNDALAPAVGVQVAAMGGAKAAVWWNGTQWTVWGI